MFECGLFEHFPKGSLPTLTGYSNLVAMCVISGGLYRKQLCRVMEQWVRLCSVEYRCMYLCTYL